MIGDSLRLHEELMLLSRNEAGRIVGNSHHTNAVSAGIMAELVLNNRIALDAVGKKTMVRLVDQRPIGEYFLDAASERIRTSKKPQQASTWILKIAGIPKLIPRLTERLYLAGFVRREEQPFLFVFKRTVFPIANAAVRKRLVDRLRDAVQGSGAVDQRTGILLTLAHGNGLLLQVFERSQLKPYKRKIKDLVEQQPLARALTQAVAASAASHAGVYTIAVPPF